MKFLMPRPLNRRMDTCDICSGEQDVRECAFPYSKRGHTPKKAVAAGTEDRCSEGVQSAERVSATVQWYDLCARCRTIAANDSQPYTSFKRSAFDALKEAVAAGTEDRCSEGVQTIPSVMGGVA